MKCASPVQDFYVRKVDSECADSELTKRTAKSAINCDVLSRQESV